MEQRSLNLFRDGGADEGTASVRLAIARNLARIYADVLNDPLPDDLRRLIERWETRQGPPARSPVGKGASVSPRQA
jgi:hypothetical protein